MSYKIPFETCQLFRDAVSSEVGEMELLDIRLGLEQVQDAQGFRELAEVRWESGTPATEEVPDRFALAFRAVSDRHQRLSIGQFHDGFSRVINDPEFVNSCKLRWEFQDKHPETKMTVHVDLGAMPDPDTLRA